MTTKTVSAPASGTGTLYPLSDAGTVWVRPGGA